ncbi:MAG: alpha-2-macroglobulin family protein, partial [Actinomycetota bacterium]
SKQFGLGESSITAKQSLQIRPSAPRFMNFGDKAELPVILQNMTDKPLTINVAIRAGNAFLTGGNGKKVTVAANDRAEIRFSIASEKAGMARFQIGAASGNFADAAEIEFPVYTPATSEAFATYGTTEENGAILQTIFAPKDVYPDFGGLEVTTSSTQLQELTDAFIYLQNYPFECSEQISSRVLSVAALRDVLTAFDAKDLPTKSEIEAKMKSDITRLQSLQHADGGFSFWRSDDESFPFVSVHVAHALARAKAKGYAVPDEIAARSLYYLKNIESKLPETYSPESRSAISAYALYVRDLFGDKDAAKAKKLLQDAGLEKLSAESLGWLLSVLADDKNSAAEVEEIKQNLLNRVTETAGNAHFVTNYKDGEYVLLSSARRADGIILEALLKVKSQESRVESRDLENLIPKIVRSLLANKIKGRWQSTQENAFVLLALDKYFQIYEKTVPNFVAKIWLGNAFAGEQKFVGRSTDSNLISVPMNYLQTREAKQNLVLDKQGDGRLYYRIGLKYAPKNLKLDAADYGFAVSRKYEAIDNAEDVKQNSDGSWTIKSGARVRVNVQMVAPTRRYHVALVDNLPAGIEIVNPGLAVSGNSYLNYSDELRKRSFWFQYQNLRDNRAEAFTTLLSAGVWNYSYLARATTPGNFVVPPAKAEEMYSPETFGRSKTDFVRVE